MVKNLAKPAFTGAQLGTDFLQTLTLEEIRRIKILCKYKL